MRLSSGLLVASGVAGLLSVAAALLAMTAASLQFGLVMLVALLGYVLVSPAARRVRWAVAAGVGLFAVVAALRLFWYQEQVDAAGWLTYGQGLAKTSMMARWREEIDRDRLAALGLALGVLCLAAGVLALPPRGGRRRVATTVLALLLLAWFGLSAARGLGRHPLPELLGTVWPALLAALLSMAALALSGWRTGWRWLLPVGLFLLALDATGTYSDLALAWSGWWSMAHPPDGVFLEVGVAVSTSPEGSLQVSWAVERAIALAGAGLVAVGALRGSRDADAS
ncbi:aminopeptidase [Micromonospora sp. NPDC049836]|uniref:aminopeptidase n=1 Tax=Micromonospora sp. NPDC049836 TaxID=3364274 RepID=UPI0037BD97CF